MIDAKTRGPDQVILWRGVAQGCVPVGSSRGTLSRRRQALRQL